MPSGAEGGREPAIGRMAGDAAGVEAAGHLSIRAEWRRAAFLIALGIAAIIVCYWPVVVAAVTVWYSSTSYNHCFLIPVITGYLLWEQRSIFSVLTPRPTGLPIVAQRFGPRPVAPP